jgi:hypothetical protein
MARLHQLGVDPTEGSIHNIGTRLDEAGVIVRSAAGWQLLRREKVARVSGGRVMGQPEAFQAMEIAAHRREAEMAYFQAYGRLSRSQLIALLQQSDWVSAPVNVNLLRADLQALQSAKLIHRVKSDDPTNWDWELSRKKGQLKLAGTA